MKIFAFLACAAALALPAGPAAAQSDACNKLTVTGHPQYPPFAWRDGARIVGVAAEMVEAIGKELGLSVESTYTGSWADAQTAARDGKVDVIFGIYFNDERARYLDYVKPAFTIDPVAVFVAKGTVFRFSGRQDLVGKKGVTNQGESYGVDFDNFMAQNLTVARAQGIDRAFDIVLKGEADYLIAGLYPGLDEAAKAGLSNRLEVLKPSLVEADMFVAFSRKSPCLRLVPAFGRKIEEMRKDGRIEAMIAKSLPR